MPKMLLITVGTSPDAVTNGLRIAKPDHVVFILTDTLATRILEDASTKAELKFLQQAQNAEEALALYLQAILEKAQLKSVPKQSVISLDGKAANDFRLALEDLREKLSPKVEAWLTQGSDYQLMADFTGGTKGMATALVMLASSSSWKGCSLVHHGDHERETGQVLPIIWDEQGHRTIEEAGKLFDEGAFAAAVRILKEKKPDVERRDPERGKLFGQFVKLCEAYDAWERFEHSGAQRNLRCLLYPQDEQNILAALWGALKAERLRPLFEKNLCHLQKMSDLPPENPDVAWVADLLANAKRRGQEGRFEDSVARLYRVTEAIGQVRLFQEYDQKANGVPRESFRGLPMEATLRQEPIIKLSLQLLFRYLSERAERDQRPDPLVKEFKALNWLGPRSILEIRNNSILAHGYTVAKKSHFDTLYEGCIRLAKHINLQEKDLPTFPKIMDLR